MTELEFPSFSIDEKEKAIVVGVQLAKQSEDEINDDLDELSSLLMTLGVPVVYRMMQKRLKLNPTFLVGSGKVEELFELAESYEASYIVFDHPLTPPQIRNLEKAICKKILDRTGVILEIFSRHAKTNQAKAQVEIAKLEYILPRMSGAWTHLQRQSGGGVRSRGMGEKQIEVDRRRARERISRLKTQLEQIHKEKKVQRKKRQNEIKIALVGYTNSGKTTLMHSLTKTTIGGKDELFATLDTRVKTLDPKTRPRILLTDTVGFIKNLPHSLVESFKSTLDEVLEADLLLHVVDVSYPHYEEHVKVTRQVLNDIGAGDIEQIMIFNKVDLLEDPILPRVLKAAYRGSMSLSATNITDAKKLRDHIFHHFVKNLVTYKISLDSSDASNISIVYKNCQILETDYEQEGKVSFSLQSTRSTMAKLRKYITDISQEDLEKLEED